MSKFSRLSIALAVALAASLAVSCGPSSKLPDGLYARIDTAKGDIVINLDYRKAPLAVANFVGLAEGALDATNGTRFYDGLSFHRVEPGFVVQGGDPAGDGSGDPGYNFPDEFSDSLKHDGPGVVAMANYGPNTNGCQFYITLAAAPSLDGSYTVFGRVVEGMDVVEKIEKGDLMRKVTIVRVGDDAKAFKTDQAAWNALYAPAIDAANARLNESREASIQAMLAKWPELKRRPDGFLVSVLKEGSGPIMHRSWLVKVDYKGMLPNGMVFDQSSLHGGPIEYEAGAGQVINGWDMMVSEMRKGEKRLVAIPPEYAYGPQGAGGVIPPNSYIVFELEITGYTE